MKLGNFLEMPTINIDVVSTPAMQPVKKRAARPTMGLKNQFLDFEKNKVQVLTLDQLCRTNKENRGDNHAKPHDIYHYEMIERMLDILILSMATTLRSMICSLRTIVTSRPQVYRFIQSWRQNMDSVPFQLRH